MTSTTISPASPPSLATRLGMPVAAVAGLAALYVPRAVAHDLDLVAPETFANLALNVGPLLVWVTVATLLSRRPLPTLIGAGVCYGAALGLVHNLAWGHVWGDQPPRLGGSLAGAWTPGTEEVLMRGATGLSSLATGVVIGLVTGLLAAGLQELARRTGARLPLGR